MCFENRTTRALGESVIQKLASLHFCIVGCGGTGANFAEMLVRTGARRITLIDGTRIDESNLNRVFSFFQADLGKPKVEVLKRHLEAIRTNLVVHAMRASFRRREHIPDADSLEQRVRDAVYEADVVFIGTDTNTSRLAIEKLHKAKGRGMLLSCGITVDPESDAPYEFECAWSPGTPPDRADDEGYGPENASFASIVLEATSVAFTMLLSHLTDADSNFKYFRRSYDANLRPIRNQRDRNVQ